MKCVNDKCRKKITNEEEAVLITPDGDFACCKECAKEYERQRDEFFENIGNDQWYKNWMNS